MKNKADLLFVAPLPPPLAGPEISAKFFINSKIKDAFRFEYLDYGFRSNNASKGHFNLKMVIAFFILKYSLIKSLILHRPSIVYYYVTATMLGWLGKDIWVILISKIFGAKVVIHMRAGHFRTNYNNSNFLFKSIIKSVIRLVELNIFQSKTLGNQFNNIVDQNKIAFVPNMIDINDYDNKTPEKFDKNSILFIGHLSHAKGYCDILSIIPDVAQIFPDIKFYFAGTKIKNEKNVFVNEFSKQKIKFIDPDYAYEKYIKNKYENNYVYLGNLEKNAKIDMIKKTNLFLLPSYSEGFSMAVLEALTLSKPIVTTMVGSSKDVIKDSHNGILVKPGSIVELKKAIIQLLENKDLRNKIALNNSLDRNKFSIQNVENKYIKIFRELV